MKKGLNKKLWLVIWMMMMMIIIYCYNVAFSYKYFVSNFFLLLRRV